MVLSYLFLFVYSVCLSRPVKKCFLTARLIETTAIETKVSRPKRMIIGSATNLRTTSPSLFDGMAEFFSAHTY